MAIWVIDLLFFSYNSILEGKPRRGTKKDFIEGIVIIGKLAHKMLLVQKACTSCVAGLPY
ncbi:hypothetical protein BK120_30925 [Paenibacillus sp. FSL A5-0031]|nr:hypothetical protein BK120_30925 [Paenibacillus sp. FSL A5-0031]